MEQGTQTTQILEYLKEGNKLTALEALDKFKCFRLAARIADIKALGYTINSEMVKVDSGKKIAQYSIAA